MKTKCEDEIKNKIYLRKVNARDRDIVIKQINKHKNAGGSKSTLKSQSTYSMGGGSVGTTKSSKSISSSSQGGVGGPGQNYLYILVADPNTYKWYTQRKIELSSRNKSLRIQNCYTPPENTIQHLLATNNPAITTSSSASSAIERKPDIETIRTNQSGISTLNRAQGEIPRNLIMKKCIIRKLKVIRLIFLVFSIFSIFIILKLLYYI